MTLVDLPDSLRSELKDPLGPIYTDVSDLLLDACDPLVTVGDVVTFHLLGADRTPCVSLVDDRTERAAVDAEIAERIAAHDGFAVERRVTNPPGTLSKPLLTALREAIDSTEPTLLDVDGEEDLATLPAVLVAPLGASIVYGQPGEGMVHVVVDEDRRRRARDLLSRMSGDTDALFSVLGVDT